PPPPPQVVSEHVMGSSADVDAFVGRFVERRKATDYLAIGEENQKRFSTDEIAAYKQMFKKLDKDASGALDQGEMADLLGELKVNSRKKRITKLLAEVDKDGSGMIEFDEFLDIVHQIKHEGEASLGALLTSTSGTLSGVLDQTFAATRA
ncbi:unnamed protein product, partial [Discosporangium mesarthrocarpum]